MVDYHTDAEHTSLSVLIHMLTPMRHAGHADVFHAYLFRHNHNCLLLVSTPNTRLVLCICTRFPKKSHLGGCLTASYFLSSVSARRVWSVHRIILSRISDCNCFS